MVVISSIILLDLIGYALFLFLLLYSAYLVYTLFTSYEERKIYRTKIKKQIMDQKNKFKDKQSGSDFENRLKKSGLRFSAFHYQLFRYSLIISLYGYYILDPLLSNDSIVISNLFIPVFLFIMTEPKFNFSVIHNVVNFLISKRKRQKTTELFTLYSLLKSELSTTSDMKQTNIYNFLRDSQSMFDYINGAISRFLSLWKTNPELAKNVFYEDIGNDNAQVLGDILYRIDNASKKEAIDVIESESEVFSYTFFEKEVQGNIKITKFFFIYASLTVFLWLAWLIVVVFSMTNSYIDTPFM